MGIKQERAVEAGLNQMYFQGKQAYALLGALRECYLSYDLDGFDPGDQTKALTLAYYYESLVDGVNGVLSLLQSAIKEGAAACKAFDGKENKHAQ